MTTAFTLSNSFIKKYESIKPNFGFNGLGEIVYLRTYSRLKSDGMNEKWHETIRRVVEGTFRMQQRHIIEQDLGWSDKRAQKSAQEMFDRMFNMKFLPPGRGMWAMGSPITEEKGLYAALNNCFTGDTEFLTPWGSRSFESAIGEEVSVFDKNGQCRLANVNSYGIQPVNEVVFKVPGRSNLTHTIKVTPNHRWVLKDGTVTTDLKVGDYIPLAHEDTEYYDELGGRDYNSGFIHGYVFGDGTKHNKYPNRHMVRVCRGKTDLASKLQYSRFKPTEYNETVVEGDPFFTIKSDIDFKSLPGTDDHVGDYYTGFVHGWLAADSYTKPVGVCLDTQNAEAAQWLIKNAPLAGYFATGHSFDSRDTNYGPRSAPLNRISLQQNQNAYLKVLSISPIGEQEVFCCEEPETQTFLLAGGIVTGNCAFTSTEYIETELTEPFTFLMDASMLGIGVGFDTKGAGKLRMLSPEGCKVYVIPDTREGWVKSLELLLESFFVTGQHWEFDCSLIRLEGAPINGFGGVASGPGPLIKMHEMIRELLTSLIGELLTVRAITDIMNLIGVCVVSGNVRRSAEIAFGDPNDEEFLQLKDYGINPERAAFGWTSNNSIYATVGMDYTRVAEQTRLNGEPGYMWLDNAREFSRMDGTSDFKDRRAKGANPCVEQSLEHRELCCLVETFPELHDDLEDFERTLKFAYLYAKTVTLGKTHWPKTNRVMLRNRRIGTSLSGLAQFLASNSLDTLKMWCLEGYKTLEYYDKVYSDWFAIPLSVKKTSIKPSGSISNLPGATSGMHNPQARHYIRRVRIPHTSVLVNRLFEAGYFIEPDSYDASSMVAEFPVFIGDGIRVESEVSMWEQLGLAAFLQRYWADNQVSCTVTFDPITEGPQIKHALDIYQYQLKGISFLPRTEKGAYAQMPYETITAERYATMLSKLKPFDIEGLSEEGDQEKYCSTDACEVKSFKSNADAS